MPKRIRSLLVTLLALAASACASGGSSARPVPAAAPVAASAGQRGTSTAPADAPSPPSAAGASAGSAAVAWSDPDLPETPRPSAPPASAPTPAAPTSGPKSPEMGWLERELHEADSLLALRGGRAHADSARLYLTWNAPWGQRRARDQHVNSCAGRDSADTLYLSFLPGRASRGFNGFTALLQIHPAAGDTLGPWWQFERTGANAGALALQFDLDSTFSAPQPWKVAGVPHLSYVRSEGAASLRLVYAVPRPQARPIAADTVYTLGRLIFRHRRDLPGCSQPVCIEWKESSLAFALKDEPIVRVGERVASWNSPGSAACDPVRGARRPASWRPGDARPSR